ncbi:DUF2127 domain-containing protein [Nostoc sp. CHAB 5784]|uniref:DUF2127 domain-containing protein n=1 Tax=Nostoc mirabile TaxID=2907820 RepID=UPI001E59DE60|nr:DUF2127 domain-containing protein [Nostoc mirabile]MCC5662637.1 DUF2127 domain-containing protein [Nostoc mirabile CHAB5784]
MTVIGHQSTVNSHQVNVQVKCVTAYGAIKYCYNTRLGWHHPEPVNQNLGSIYLGGCLQKRPLGLVAIVLYKSFAALLLMLTSIALLLTLKNYQTLEVFSENYVLEGKSIIIDWLLKKVLNLNPRTLEVV